MNEGLETPPTPLAGEAATEPGAGAEAAEPEPGAALAERLAEREAELEQARRAWLEKENSLLRQLADRENQIRRLERSREQELELRRGELLTSLIGVLDDFDRALEHLPSDLDESFAAGVMQIARRLREVLMDLGLKPIEALGQKFDPSLHEALMQVESETVAKGHVVLEMQKGYLLGERVLRPSKVAVSS